MNRDIYYHPEPACPVFAERCSVCTRLWCRGCLPVCDCGPRKQRALKRLPVGRNWQYSLTPGVTLLRNVDSVEARLDGWFVTHADPRLVSAHVRIDPEVALILLRGLRAAPERR